MSGSAPPRIIQGGMGVAISGWPLAAAVARRGELGVVSGTALEVVCARRLQLGDPDGDVRRALAAFPVPHVADRVLDAYFVPGGKPEANPFKKVRSFTIEPVPELEELTVAANFVEVFLAKEGHNGLVGINYMRKLELPLIFALYGAVLAGVDYVIVGAGNPKELPDLVTRLANHQEVALPLRVQGSTSTDDIEVRFDPRTMAGADRPTLPRPAFLAIVASLDLAAGLRDSDVYRPDGFVIEGPSAGGHNAPPRGPRTTDDRGQPVYDHLDEVDLAGMARLGLPFWLAGSYGTPDGLRSALEVGASGIQVGTAFALCRESGLDSRLKRQILQQVVEGTIDVRTDWRASPTGFPFKVVEVAGSLSDPHIYTDRRRVCDLGVLRVPYMTPEGSIGYRCPGEPERAYVQVKGGRAPNTEGRICLCNGLLATAGFAQLRPGGYVEPPVITGGADYRAVADLLATLPPGQEFYTADDVIDYLRQGRTHLQDVR